MKIKILSIFISFLILNSTFIVLGKIMVNENSKNEFSVKINIDPYSVIYEGDIINSTITGNYNVKYWQINNQNKHTTFYDDDPVIYDPEPTPLDTEYVTLTVNAENEFGKASDSVKVMIKRIYLKFMIIKRLQG